jgi:hypothetical protein
MAAAAHHLEIVTFALSMLLLVCVPIFILHFNFQNGGGGHLKFSLTLPLL